MKKNILLTGILALACVSAAAQVGSPYIHDPSTIAECDGKYYTFGTGGGGLIPPTAGSGKAARSVPAAALPRTPSRSVTVTSWATAPRAVVSAAVTPAAS
jgi:hypothetical protein